MKKFNYKKRNPFSGPHLLGVLLILAGVFALVSPYIVTSGSSIERILAMGIGAIVIGLLIVSSYSGVIMDFEEKRSKEYSSICGFKIGEWSSLPEIVTVKVIAKSYISSNTPNGVSPTLSGRVTDYKVLLYPDQSKPIFSFDYSKQKKAESIGKKLASDLQAELIISST